MPLLTYFRHSNCPKYTPWQPHSSIYLHILPNPCVKSAYHAYYCVRFAYVWLRQALLYLCAARSGPFERPHAEQRRSMGLWHSCFAAGIWYSCSAAGLWHTCSAAGIWHSCSAADLWHSYSATGIQNPSVWDSTIWGTPHMYQYISRNAVYLADR